MIFKKKINYIYIGLSFGIALIFFLSLILNSLPLVKERFLTFSLFATGPYSPFQEDQSWVWMNNFGFGFPRYMNPEFNSFEPVSYLGYLISEPYLSQVLWFFGLLLSIWGSYRLFRLFISESILAFMCAVLFALSGVHFIQNFSFFSYISSASIIWAMYWSICGFKNHKKVYLVLSALLYAQSYYLYGANYLWFYVLSGNVLYILGSVVLDIFRKKPIYWNFFIKDFKDIALFLSLIFILLAVSILPFLEVGSDIIHYRDQYNVRLTDPLFYRGASLNLWDFFYLPFLFPDMFKSVFWGRYDYANLSYVGYIPISFSVLFLIHANIKTIFRIIGILICILLASASLPPIDTIVRFFPPFDRMRCSALWLYLWNLCILGMAGLGIQSIGKQISLRKAWIFTLLNLIFVILLIAFFHFFVRNIYEEKLIPWPIEAVPIAFHYDDWNWIGVLKPVLMIILVLGILTLTLMSKLSQKTLIWFLVILSMVDIISYNFNSRFFFNIYGQIKKKDSNIEKNSDLKSDELEFLKFDQLNKKRFYIFASSRIINNKFLEEKLYPLENIGKVYRSLIMERHYLILNHFFLRKKEKKIGVGDYLFFDEFINSIGFLDVARVFNVNYYLSKNSINEPDFEEKKMDFRFGTRIYEDKKAYPRAFIYQDFERVDGLKKSYQVLKNQDINLLNKAVIEMGVEEMSNYKDYRKDGEGVDLEGVSVISYKPTEVILKASVKEKSLLFMSDLNYPGWSVTVDGEEKKIYSTNVVGRGVFVEPGQHEVVFRFFSKTFFLGAVLSALGYLFVLVYFIVFFVQKRKARLNDI